MVTKTRKPKKTFAERLASYPTYNSEKEGYGSQSQWRSAFDDALHNMGIGEAKAIVGEDDPFKILGLALTVTAAEAKSAFRKLILKWHPDKNPGNTEAHGMTQRIIAAYKIIEKSLK